MSLLAALAALLTAAAPGPGAAAPEPPKSRVEVGWDPATGRGDVRHYFESGDVARTCFHCGYPGYTGGLVVGNFNGSGYGYYPKEPLRGFKSVNVLCATDESLWDLDEKAEYTYGWSENYGKGDDGKRLEYQRGRILEPGPGRVVLQSENAGGCYRVTKVATTRAGAAWWIVATRITNRCDRPIRFDFFTGDDPWLGLYRSSDGDVGWSTEAGLLERETEIVPFTSGGIYDLGNRALGQAPDSFSNQAMFFEIDPGAPLPDHAFLANRFAHSAQEIDPKHVLTNQQMIALNLGWTGRTLAPGKGLTVALAMGLAKTGEPGATPKPQPITDADWSVWRQHLTESDKAGQMLEFAAEEVAMDVGEGRLAVDAVYHVRNPGSGSISGRIVYPILVGPGQAAPESVRVDGRVVPVRVADGRPSAQLDVSAGPHSLARFRIEYEQKLTARQAGYLVTTARRWPGPITRAIFTIRRPEKLAKAKLSFPVASTRREGGFVVDTLVQRDFWPDREVTVAW